MRFGANVQRLRKDRDLTQEHVAYHAGLAVSSLSKLETGKAGVHMTKLPLLADALGVNVSDLFAGL